MSCVKIKATLFGVARGLSGRRNLSCERYLTKMRGILEETRNEPLQRKNHPLRGGPRIIGAEKSFLRKISHQNAWHFGRDS